MRPTYIVTQVHAGVESYYKGDISADYYGDNWCHDINKATPFTDADIEININKIRAADYKIVRVT